MRYARKNLFAESLAVSRAGLRQERQCESDELSAGQRGADGISPIRRDPPAAPVSVTPLVIVCFIL